MKAQFKTEWVVEVSGKKSKKKTYRRDTRQEARSIKNVFKALGHNARILRNQYALIEQGVIR